ncbi:MAG: ABC transporter ATP-binding protein [Peptococcaceae bacterium]|nr:ABC transporter ATP-binding protein [Peptococcaceae bacterium]
MLKLENLSFNYHTQAGEIRAIENIDLEIREGEFLSLIGPSGCGKSTLLSLISGMLKPSRGRVLLDGEEIRGPDAKIAWMPQRDQLFPWRTILGNVLIGIEVRRKLTPADRKKAVSLLEKYGLGDFINHYPNQLSGGMRQRAALIRTLAVDPEILLLDEPFSALDYQTRLTVSDEVRLIIAREQKTSILVTHDINEGISMSDRVAVMSRRPARIKAVHDIRLSVDELSPMKRREAPEFRSYFNQIWKELDVQ